MAFTQPEAGDHVGYMRLCLDLARQSPALPTNYRVGAALVHSPSNKILATGYTNELPGNTHAEQVCLTKLATERGVSDPDVAQLAELAQGEVIFYSTVEPCAKRLSGNLPCVQRILDTRTGLGTGINIVYVGVHEPEKFVQGNNAQALLEAAGIGFVHVAGLEEEILQVATAGHN